MILLLIQSILVGSFGTTREGYKTFGRYKADIKARKCYYFKTSNYIFRISLKK